MTTVIVDWTSFGDIQTERRKINDNRPNLRDEGDSLETTNGVKILGSLGFSKSGGSSKYRLIYKMK